MAAAILMPASPPPRPQLRLVGEDEAPGRGCVIELELLPGYQVPLLAGPSSLPRRRRHQHQRQGRSAASVWLRRVAFAFECRRPTPIEGLLKVRRRRGGHRMPSLNQWSPRRSSGASMSRRERSEMQADIAVLENLGVYDTRPSCYEPVLPGIDGHRASNNPPPPGPCPWVSCKHTLFLDVDDSRRTPVVVVNFPGRDVDQIPETCALRVAAAAADSPDDEGLLFSELGLYFNVTWQRARQITRDALAKLKASARRKGRKDEE